MSSRSGTLGGVEGMGGGLVGATNCEIRSGKVEMLSGNPVSTWVEPNAGSSEGVTSVPHVHEFVHAMSM